MPLAKAELVTALGEAMTNEVVARLRRLAHIPDAQIAALAHAALSENWGRENYALEK